MRKLLLLIVLFLLTGNNKVFSQQRTYYFVAKEYYDDYGVKHQCNMNKFFTFNGNLAYESDANGNSVEATNVYYHYRGNSKGNLWYMRGATNPYSRQWQWYNQFQLLVSSDFSVINEMIALGTGYWTYVYHRKTKSEPLNKLPDIRY